jgi:hypothetical protein
MVLDNCMGSGTFSCAFSGIFLAFKCPVALVFSQIISYLSQSKLETPKTLSKGVRAKKESRVAAQLRDTLEAYKFFQVISKK